VSVLKKLISVGIEKVKCQQGLYHFTRLLWWRNT